MGTMKNNPLPPHPGSEDKLKMESEQPEYISEPEPKLEMKVPEEEPYGGPTIYATNDPNKDKEKEPEKSFESLCIFGKDR